MTIQIAGLAWLTPKLQGIGIDNSIAWSALPAYPTVITFSPASPLIDDDATAGTLVATIAVLMLNGSSFSGTLTLTNDDSGNFALSGSTVVTNFTPPFADVGNRTVTVRATQNGISASASLTITVATSFGLTNEDGSILLTAEDGTTQLTSS